MRDFRQNKKFGGRSEMHKTTCDDCGKRCEVPFKPTSSKPVYCSDCFGDSRGNDRGRDRGRGNDRGRGRDFGRDSGRDRQMHKAICADCGDKCEVPFKPSGDKPVLCSSCFGGNSSGGKNNSNGTQHTEILAELAELHEKQSELDGKIDKVIALLRRETPVKEVTVTKAEVEEAVKEVKKEKKTTTKKKAPAKKVVKKVATKKTVAKKPATKKAPAKKTTKAKAKKK